MDRKLEQFPTYWNGLENLATRIKRWQNDNPGYRIGTLWNITVQKIGGTDREVLIEFIKED